MTPRPDDDNLSERAAAIMESCRFMQPCDFLDTLIIASVAAISTCWPVAAWDSVMEVYVTRVRETLTDMQHEKHPMQ